MKFRVATTKRFLKTAKLCASRGYDMDKLDAAVDLLKNTGTLPASYFPHKLTGYKGNNMWECHLEPDWLLVWERRETELVLVMVATGTHSDLF